jgi:hypothetical protein
VRTFEALRRLGWSGTYLCYGHIQAEEELKRIADGGFNVFSANALFQDNLPVQQEMRQAAADGKYSYPVSYADEGWITGRALEQILTKAAWPADADKIAEAMSHLDLDTQGLRGGPLVWTAENHFRTKQYYRFYRYDPEQKSIVRVRDWLAVDVVN